MEIFNNREIACFIWFVILFALIGLKAEIRKPIYVVLKSFFRFQIILPILCMI